MTTDFKRNSSGRTRIHEYSPPPINALVTALNTVTQTPLLSAASTILPIQRVHVFQDPLSAATRSEDQSFDNTVAQSQLPVSSVVNQNASTPAIHDSFSTNSLSLPSQRIRSLVDIVQRGKLPTSATVSQSVSTTPVYSSFNIRSQRQIATLATNSLPSQPIDCSADMVPQRQLPASSTVPQIAPTTPVITYFDVQPRGQLAVNNSVNTVAQKEVTTSASISQMVSRPVQPFVSENTTPESLQIPGAVGSFDERLAQSLLNTGSQLVSPSSYASSYTEREMRIFKAIFETVKAAETSFQEENESIGDLHSLNIIPSALLAHASSRIAQCPGLNLLADVIGEAQRDQYEHSIANRANIQVTVFIKYFVPFLTTVYYNNITFLCSKTLNSSQKKNNVSLSYLLNTFFFVPGVSSGRV